MGDSPYRGHKPPAQRDPVVYDVVAPAPGETLDLTILDYSILGAPVHWCWDAQIEAHRSRPCLEPDICPWHQPENRLYWLGFLAVYNHVERARQILRISRETAEELAKRHVSHFGLSGQRLKFVRPEQRRTGKLLILSTDNPPLKPVPYPHPLRRSLCVVFQVPDLPWDFANGRDPEPGRI